MSGRPQMIVAVRPDRRRPLALALLAALLLGLALMLVRTPLAHAADDEATGSAALLLEDLKHSDRFIEAGRAMAAAGKPVFAYSMVRSDQGRDAAMSHTGAMVGSYAARVAVLRAIEKDAFFRTVRAGLVTDLYNQKEIWPLFGYEGESFSHGGYIDRGFNDIAWL